MRIIIVHVTYIFNHSTEKKDTILIFFSIVFDSRSVPILSDFVRYF